MKMCMSVYGIDLLQNNLSYYKTVKIYVYNLSYYKTVKIYVYIKESIDKLLAKYKE